MSTDGYNYADFAEHVTDGGMEVFERVADRRHAGSRAPSFPVTRLDDTTTVQLDELWRRTPAVLEFGSFT